MRKWNSGPGYGADGLPCPRGCENVVKDEAWWAGREAKLAAARVRFPDATIDRRTGWLIHSPTGRVETELMRQA
jgi:hypothetical protein